MTTPTKTIGAGLDARERAKSSGRPKLSAFANAPKNIAGIRALVGVATTKRNRLCAIRDEWAVAVEDSRNKKTVEFDQIGWVENDNGIGRIDTLGKDQRKKMVEGEVRRFQKDLVKKTEEERQSLLNDLRSLKDGVDLVRDQYASPIAILMRSTVESAERATSTANLSQAGPVELDSAFRDAVIDGNRDLAAAAATRYDAMTKDTRKLVNFRKQDVAEALVGEAHIQAIGHIGLLDIAVAQGELAAKEATGVKISPDEKIRVGMLAKDLARKTGISLDQIDNDDAPENETFEERLDRLYPGKPGSGKTLNIIDGTNANKTGESA